MTTDPEKARRAVLLKGIGRTDDPSSLARRLAERFAAIMAEPGNDRGEIPPGGLALGGKILADCLAADDADPKALAAASFEADCRSRMASTSAGLHHSEAALADLAARLWSAAEAALMARLGEPGPRADPTATHPHHDEDARP